MSDLDDEELRATRKLNGVDICEGDYVRCKNGKIAKVKDINEDYIYFDKEIYWRADMPIFELDKTFIDYIAKHSPNLIDLIEVGDYVNGILVQKIAEPSLANDYRTLIYCNECEGLYEGIFDNNEIKNIVTHQQFNSVMYKVKE